jgi:hypothetical protein
MSHTSWVRETMNDVDSDGSPQFGNTQVARLKPMHRPPLPPDNTQDADAARHRATTLA